MCPVHIFDIREAKIAKETHDLWGRTVPPQGFGRQGCRVEKGDRSVNIAWESKQYFHLKTFSSIETRPLIGEIKLRLLSLFGQLPRELGERRAD